MMDVEIQFGTHSPLKNDDGEPYEFDLRPVNGKMIRAYHECRLCDCLYRAGSKSMCVASSRSADKHQEMKDFLDAQDRLEEDFADD